EQRELAHGGGEEQPPEHHPADGGPESDVPPDPPDEPPTDEPDDQQPDREEGGIEGDLRLVDVQVLLQGNEDGPETVEKEAETAEDDVEQPGRTVTRQTPRRSHRRQTSRGERQARFSFASSGECPLNSLRRRGVSDPRGQWGMV